MLPRIPASDIDLDNWRTNRYNLCVSCLTPAKDNQLHQPGARLHTETLPEELNAPMPSMPQGSRSFQNSQKLHAENSPDNWLPHYWAIAVPSDADQTSNSFIVHARENNTAGLILHRPRLALYKDIYNQTKVRNLRASNNHIRTITCRLWSSNSVHAMDPQQPTAERQIFVRAGRMQHADRLKEYRNLVSPLFVQEPRV